MLSCDDIGVSKNVCFVFSCLVINVEGYARFLKNIYLDNILRTFSEFFSVEDSEIGWFVVMWVGFIGLFLF